MYCLCPFFIVTFLTFCNFFRFVECLECQFLRVRFPICRTFHTFDGLFISSPLYFFYCYWQMLYVIHLVVYVWGLNSSLNKLTNLRCLCRALSDYDNSVLLRLFLSLKYCCKWSSLPKEKPRKRAECLSLLRRQGFCRNLFFCHRELLYYRLSALLRHPRYFYSSKKT